MKKQDDWKVEIKNWFKKTFQFDEDSEMYYPADYSKGLPAKGIEQSLVDKFSALFASQRETLAVALEEKKGKMPPAIEHSLISPLESYRKEDQMYGYDLGLTDAAAHIRKQ